MKKNKNGCKVTEENSIEDKTKFGRFSNSFKKRKKGFSETLRDDKSDKKTSIPIRYNEDAYLTRPDGELIGNIKQQKKCDFMIYFEMSRQVDFLELKGSNISQKEYSPYDQIMQTIDFLNRDKDLANIACCGIKHAFIVSPEKQKIPKGINSKERALWKKLAAGMKTEEELVHYVRVVPKVLNPSKASQNGRNIVCSSSIPVELPLTGK